MSDKLVKTECEVEIETAHANEVLATNAGSRVRERNEHLSRTIRAFQDYSRHADFCIICTVPVKLKGRFCALGEDLWTSYVSLSDRYFEEYKDIWG